MILFERVMHPPMYASMANVRREPLMVSNTSLPVVCSPWTRVVIWVAAHKNPLAGTVGDDEIRE